MKNIIVLTLLAVMFQGCQLRNDSESQTHLGDFEVEVLFENDVCKVYRFWDGHYVYYSDCTGRSQYDTAGPDGVKQKTP